MLAGAEITAVQKELDFAVRMVVERETFGGSEFQADDLRWRRQSSAEKLSFAAAERSAKLCASAQIGPLWRSGELFDARWGGGAGTLDTAGPTPRRGLRARSGLDVVKGAGSGEVELFA